MAADWKRCTAGLAGAGHAVRRVDLWRYLDCNPMSLEEFGRAFCDEVEQGGDEENVLIGYSMGGRLALHALLEGEERGADCFQAAVIVSADPGLADEGERLRRMARDAEWAGKALVGDWDRFLREWQSQAVLGGPPDHPAAALAPLDGLGDRHLLLPRRQAVARSFMDWSLGKQSDLRGRLGMIRCPVLWVTGARDQKFSRLAAQAMPMMGAGRHLECEGAGHRVPWERAREFERAVLEFLKPRLTV